MIGLTSGWIKLKCTDDEVIETVVVDVTHARDSESGSIKRGCREYKPIRAIKLGK